MRVGVITFHNRCNYGGTLQAIALCRFLQRIGHEAEIINYQHGVILGRDLAMATWHAVKGIDVTARKIGVFSKFLKQWNGKPTAFGGGSLRRFYGSRYDAVISGSDEVWKTNSERGFDPAYFLGFTGESVRRIAYAASIGGDTWPDDRKDQIHRLLKRFDFISVRDEATGDAVVDLGFAPPQRVVDPTFLPDLWSDIVPLERRRKYIFVSGYLSQQAELRIADFARERNLEVVAGGYAYRFLPVAETVIHPLDWLSAIRGAELVASSLFHASVFSVVFGKNFLVFVPAGKQRKIRDLLRDTDSGGAIVQSNAPLDDSISLGCRRDLRHLDVMRGRSVAFLEEALALRLGQCQNRMEQDASTPRAGGPL